MRTKHIYLTYAFLLCLSACQDEEIISAPEDNTQTRAITATSTATSALTSADGGKTWIASRRVPLVGEGRIVDDMSNALVEALTANQGIANILDADLTNSASFNGVVTANSFGTRCEPYLCWRTKCRICLFVRQYITTHSRRTERVLPEDLPERCRTGDEGKRYRSSINSPIKLNQCRQ